MILREEIEKDGKLSLFKQEIIMIFFRKCLQEVQNIIK